MPSVSSGCSRICADSASLPALRFPGSGNVWVDINARDQRQESEDNRSVRSESSGSIGGIGGTCCSAQTRSLPTLGLPTGLITWTVTRAFTVRHRFPLC